MMVREGKRVREIVSSGFDYERWRKTFERHTGKDKKVQDSIATIVHNLCIIFMYISSTYVLVY